MEIGRAKDFSKRGKVVKDDIRGIIADLNDIRRKNKTIEPAESFEEASKFLDKDSFTIAVCGEVSQGKSQFINALIGREILPVDQHSTTSQVFRISSGEKETYSLVFTDGTKESIDSLERVIKYGSSLESALVEDPIINGRAIQWIEICLPIKFLPPNISLFDTPGLGSLHFSHAQITYRCLEESDAVLFLRSPRSPLETTEIDFLEKVFSTTDNVLFVQTKADLYDEDTRNSIADRDKEILSSKFDASIQELYNRKIPFCFWSVSSVMALMAARDVKEKNRQIHWVSSKFEALFAALELLVFRTTTYTPSCLACYEVAKYETRLLQSVEDEIQGLKTVDQNEREKLRRQCQQNLNDFNENWKADSAKMREVSAKVSNILRVGTQNAQSLFSANSETRDSIVQQINALPDDLQCVREFADGLGERISEDIANEWRRIQDRTRRKITSVLSDFRLSFDDDMNERRTHATEFSFSTKSATLFETSRNLFSGVMVGSCVGGVAGVLTAKVGVLLAPFTGGLSAIFGFLAWAAGAVGALWGGASSLQNGRVVKAQQAKKELIASVDNFFRKISREFLSPQIDQDSKVVQFFEDVKKQVSEVCSNVVQREKENMERENQRISDGYKLSEKERNEQLTRLENIRKQLAGQEPSSIESRLEECVKELDAINKECEF